MATALSPIKLGPLDLKNRLVLTPHVSYLGRDHLPTRKLAEYLGERAAGGVGLITVEASSTHPSNVPYEGVLKAYDPRSIEGYRLIVETVKPHGAHVLLELAHKGTGQTSALSERPLLAPSSVVDIIGQEVPKAMDQADLDELRDSFLLCGRHAIEAGFDGIEVHATHGYLLQQFLSPLTNKRTDDYGGSLENRMRLMTDILRGLRELLGPDRALGVRLAGHELTQGGLDADALSEVAAALVAAGLVDHLSVTGATNNSYHKIIAPMEESQGLYVPYAATIKARIGSAVPVIVTGKIRTLAEADEVIANGQADMVGMLRAHVADPDFIRKTIAGEPIRPCVGANVCIARIADRRELRCVQNPAIGAEAEIAEREAALEVGGLRLTVVGGGPAGLKAAETAARLGARVTLFERSPALGGQLRWISGTRASLFGTASYLIDRIAALGVEVHTGTPWEGETGDALIVATGSEPDRNGFTPLTPDRDALPGVERAVFPDELLAGVEPGTGRALVVEDEIGWRGFEVATLLARNGYEVQIVTAHPRFGIRMAFYQELSYLQEALLAQSIRVLSNHLVTALGEHVTALELNNREVVDLGEFALVCVSRYRRSRLPAGIGDATVIGDAASPRTTADAVREGYWKTLETLEAAVQARVVTA